MSIPRPTLRASLLAIAVVAVSACSSSASPSGGGSTAAGATAGTAATAGKQPTAGTQPTTATPLTGANNPPIADGAFGNGKLHVEISGDVNKTIDIPLQGAASFTAAGSTILNFADPTAGNVGAVAISPEGNVITVTSAAITAAGSSAMASGVGCTIAVTQSDASRLAGNFDCKRLPSLVNSQTKQVIIDMRGTFEASR